MHLGDAPTSSLISGSLINLSPSDCTRDQVDFGDNFTFLGSAGLLDIARARGLWDGSSPFDFTRDFSLGTYGEYSSKYYSGRRMWDGYRRFAPSLSLPAEYGNLKQDAPDRPWGTSVYPFSARPDVPLTLRDVFWSIS